MTRIWRQLIATIPALMLATLVLGCGGSTGDVAKPGENPDAKPAAPPAAGPKKGAKTATVEVKDVSFEQLETALMEHKGTVVYVDFWATWCVPCVAGFPHFVELHKKYADQGLTCISVSMDKQSDPETYSQAKVLAFLKEKGATFPNFVVADPERDDSRLRERFGKGPGIPYAVLFDRQGNRVADTRPDNEKRLTLEQLDKKLVEELAK